MAEEEKILLGMSRPPQPPTTAYVDKKTGETKYAAVMICNAGCHQWTVEGVRWCWERGHFDTPVYATKQEIIDRMIEKGVVPVK